MTLFGLTGGMGMGKSTAANLLAEFGVAVADTDQIARQIVEPGQPALEEIKAQFGIGILDSDGALNRAELADRVFRDNDARRKLEAILHPRIRAIWRQQVETWRRDSRNIGVVIIPLLFETNAKELFDAVICVACSLNTQRQRLKARGWSDEQITQRSLAQWPTEKKMLLSDFVVWTEGSLELHREQLRRILRS